MIIKKEDFENNINLFNNSIFVYPTDSIYGIGCDATNYDLIKKLREIKDRDTKPFSIIALSIEWVKDNFLLDDVEEDLVNQFGLWIKVDGLLKPFTLLLTPKNNSFLPENLTFGLPKVGVRIPKHWISSLVNKLGFPIVTTSVNVSGNPHITNISEIDEDIAEKIELVLDEGELKGNPSTIITVNEKKEIVYLKR